MHIALIHNKYIPRGGMERYVTDMVKGFTAAGDRVTVITAKTGPGSNESGVHDIIVIKQGHIPKPLRSFHFARSVQKILGKSTFDISISTTRSWGQDITVCGGTHRSFLAHMDKLTTPVAQLEIAVEQKAYSLSKQIIAHSNMLRDELITFYGISSERITVIHPPVDPAGFRYLESNTNNTLKERFGLSPDTISLLFPSTGHKRKGLDLLLDAFELLPRGTYELVIAGTEMKPLIRHREYIKHLGYCNDMNALYQAVDFTILPSRYEPFGMVVPESLMCGTPVLISKYAGARDILNDSNSMVFAELTPQCIAETIQEAARKKFTVERDLIEKHHMLLYQHIDTVKKLCKSIYRE